MNFNPFCGRGNWYKGNLHAHSTLSDGACSPEELKQLYLEEGYSFLAYTEHNFFADLSRLNDSQFLAFPGAEVKSYPPYEDVSCSDYRTYHLLCLAGTATPQPGFHIPPLRNNWEDHHLKTQEFIDQMTADGMLVTVNHPIWSRLLPEDLLSLEGFFALEIYNAQCAVDGDDAGEGVLYWDLLLRQKKRIWGYAADDNHNVMDLISKSKKKIDKGHPRWPSCKAWVQVYAETLSQRAIAEALKRGRFYSSTGPEIFRYEIIDNTVIVECSEVVQIDFVTYQRRGHSVRVPEGLCIASYRLHGDEAYVRVQCTDRSGHRAWTNPIFLRCP